MKTSMLVKTALIAGLTAATSQIAIPQPFSAVPITLQVFFILLAGAVLGPAYGALSVLVYVLMGVIGLPVFAKGASGIGVLAGPLGGYLFGFIAAAAVTGFIVSRGRGSASRLALGMIAGIITVYLFGVLQLALISRISIAQAIIGGALPFILVDLAKGAVAAVVARRLGLAATE